MVNIHKYISAFSCDLKLITFHYPSFSNLNFISLGMGHEHFWTSGTDQGEEGKFFWMSNGKPVTFENWNAGEPNNFV